MKDHFDLAVVGAGVVGCAVAERFSRRGESCIILEREARAGEGVSSRNSGVIHSGLYYPPGSLKAQACIRGNRLLYAWARDHQVWHQACGKLVVARNPDEETALEALWTNAQACGAQDIQRLTAQQAAAREPAVKVLQALWCPHTGIIDAAELVNSLLGAATAQGTVFAPHSTVQSFQQVAGGFELSTSRGPVVATKVVNAAGLYADDVARMAGVDRYRIHPWRGDYFRLTTTTTYRHLIYPVKAKGAAGLGVHLTLDRAGSYRLGPDVQPVERKDDFSAAPQKLDTFLEAACHLLGPLSREQLRYDGCGIRPKLRAPGETEERDFVVSQDLPGFVNMVGIESPGLTAALDLAERVAMMWS